MKFEERGKMNELTIFNQELIPVYTTDTGEKVVIGRELHDALGIGKDYSSWFRKMTDYGFTENDDFSLLTQKGEQKGSGGHNRIDHILKFDMAKHICMIQRTEVGMKIRQKLIDLEKTLNHKDSYMIADPIERARAWIEEQKKLKALELQNAQMKPKALFAEAVETSSTSILIGDMAKLLRQNGVEVGQRRLFDWLRTNGWLMKIGESRNMPTQKAMEKGYFEIRERTISNPDGSVRITKTTKVTGKGQVWLTNEFMGDRA
jgi:anti-repressor protein